MMTITDFTRQTMFLPDTGINFNQEVEEFKRSLILSALIQKKWNKRQAAKLIGIPISTLYRKMQDYAIPLDHVLTEGVSE